MSHIGIGGNLIQPNKQCLSCKYWEPASKSYLGFSIDGRNGRVTTADQQIFKRMWR